MLAACAAAALAHTCVPAANNADSEYSVPLLVGSRRQELRVTPDTGSFQLVLGSAQCVGCEGHCMGCPQHRLFDQLVSSTFVDAREQVISAYGQGQVLCDVGNDNVELGGLSTPSLQAMQLIVSNQLQGFSQDASYDGIMGLGVTHDIPLVNKTNHTKVAPSLLSTLNISSFGICFSLVSGEGGRLDLGSGIPGLSYHDVPGVGVDYWMIALHRLTVGHVDVGCGAAPYCQAIIDSGTTLMGLPKDMLMKVLEAIGPINPDCSNVDQLPTITLKLQDGHILTLPPSIYVAQLQDLTVTQPVKVGPFTAHLPVGTEAACTHLFFESDLFDHVTSSPVLLIGMPIFRRYAIRFTRGMSPSESHAIGFSPLQYDSSLCASCDATPNTTTMSLLQQPADGSNRGNTALQPTQLDTDESMSGRAAQVQRISARRLRMPSWAATLTPDESNRYWL